MKINIENDMITIQNIDKSTFDKLEKYLSYKDRSKEFQLRKHAKNPFVKNTPFYKKLQNEVYGCLLKTINENTVKLHSGFAYIFNNLDVIDNRKDTGKDISLPWKNKPFPLRDYQQEAVDKMIESYRGVVNYATGLGKTLVSVYAIKQFKKKTLVVCPSESIAVNFYNELCSAFGENKVGFFSGKKKKIKDITVGIAGSVNNHVDKFVKEDLGLIIFDETHHTPATTFFNITDKLGYVGRIFGLTATSFRSDGKDIMITAGVGPTIVKKDIIWGINSNWLAKPYIVVRKVDTFGKDYKGDKLKNYKQHVLKSQELNDRIIKDIDSFIKAGKSVLCLVNEVEHGRILSEALGLNFATGLDKNSQSYVDQLNKGSIPGLIGTDKCIGEGTDTKRVDVLVLANFVASKGLLWQNLGRGMRLYGDKKHVIILDYCPTGSNMLTRHAQQRIDFYKEITKDVKVV